MIELDNIAFTYQMAKKPALRHVNLAIKKGEFVVITGPSGCGKTTLTRVLNRLVPLYYEGTLSGNYQMNGRDMSACSICQASDSIGSVFQDPRTQFFTRDTVSEVAFGCENKGLARTEIIKRVDNIFEELAIVYLKGKNLLKLSSGERQFVAIASVCCTGTPVLVFDEPTANLDTAAIAKLTEILLKLKEKGYTIIISEHRLYYLKDLADTVYLMKDGSISSRMSGRDFYLLSPEACVAKGVRVVDQRKLVVPLKKSQSFSGKLKVEDLSFSYSGQLKIFQNANLDFARGEVVGIIGSNGAGKTTLMELICGLKKPDNGRFTLDGKELSTPARIARFYYVMQDVDYQVFTESVWTEMLLSANGNNNEEKAEAILAKLQLSILRDHHPATLSGGQKQRLSIAIACMKNADVLCFDEPTSGLDYENMKAVCATIRETASLGKVVLVVSHDYEMLLASCDQIVKIDHDGFQPPFRLTNKTVEKLRLEVRRMNKRNTPTGVKNSLLTQLVNDAGKHGKKIYGSVICAVLSAIASFFPFFCIYQVGSTILHVLATDQTLSPEILLPPAIGAIIGAVTAFVLYYIALLLGHIAGFHIKKNLKIKIFRAMSRKRLGFFEQHSTGELRKIIDENTAQAEIYLSHQLPDFVASFSVLMVIVLCMIPIDWRMGLATVFPMILAFILQRNMMNKDYAAYMGRYQAALAELNHHAVEYVRGISVIKIFGKEMKAYRQFYRAVSNYKDNVIAYALRMRRPMTLFTILINVSFVFLIPIATLLLWTGESPLVIAGSFLFYVTVSPLIATTLTKTMYLSSYQMMTQQGLSQIDELISGELTEDPEEKMPAQSPIVFRDLSFAYPGVEKSALSNLNFSVQQGDTVSLVGRSGSGKSTVLKLLLRFYENWQGDLLIDGSDIRKIPVNKWLEQFAVVFQDSQVLRKSILENVQIAKPQATKEQVWAALMQAQCADMLKRAPAGLDTVIGEGGFNISGGERQRICIARAILKNAPVILLDEATANLDDENSSLIENALKQLSAGKTVLKITHKLTSLRSSDRVIMLEQGEIVQVGIHANLCTTPGPYRNMWQEQLRTLEWSVDRVRE